MSKKKSPWKIVRRVLLGSAILFFGSTILVTLLYSFINPPITPLMAIRFFQAEKGQTYRLTKDWVPIESISPAVYRAAVASEDNLFLHHNGFDLKAIEKAQKYNERMKGRKTHGASTISQQTAKNVFLWPQRSYLRKGLEVYFTGLIEICWSKRRIMEVYLNVMETGKGIYGIEKAAQIYYHKSAAKLTRSEAAMIIACLPNPRKRRPDRPTSYLSRRQAQIVGLMSKIEPVTF